MIEETKKVKAELSYNPYLLETDIKFNGIEPRINSRVEKYRNVNLQDWINDIPEIFFEEMNGYDFKLEFTGTELDYSEVQQAFKRAGVSEKKVEIIHIKELEARNEKMKRMRDLLDWLKSNPNEHFDYETFIEQNDELFNGSYSLYVFQDKYSAISQIEWEGVSAERIVETDELSHTDLNHVPIVVIIGEENVIGIQSITKFLKGRNDVADNQVFFYIDEKLDQGIVTRTLIDLGYKEPQIVDEIDDISIKKYFELYPQTDYLTHAIEVLAKKTIEVEDTLSIENEASEETSSEINNTIKETEKLINKLKEADNRIINRENIDIMPEFSRAKIDMLTKIVNWRRKKTKITSEDEAGGLSIELSKEASFSYDAFSKEVAGIEERLLSYIQQCLKEKYLTGELNKEYLPDGVRIDSFDICHTPWIEKELMEIKEYVPVKRKEQGLFFMPKNTSNSLEMDMETTYYIQKWREYAISVVEPMADSLIQNRIAALKKYDERLAAAYHKQLTNMIDKYETEKEAMSQQLSSDEKQLQVDNYWIKDFKSQLKKIER